ncbi:hypothetical protein ACFYRY_13480 [Streptomyces sp. NPDC005263]|uniref:hypothetical protein n=1 Tax=Streptomyces sp. NPDC005263 TaxID=3364711 RepID=UPI003677895A
MRRTRIEKRRRPARTGRTTDDRTTDDRATDGRGSLRDLLDPRDPDIVRAKRASRDQGGAPRP